MTIKYGYVRVSTDKDDFSRGQTLEQQLASMEEYGVPPENIYQEKISGKENTTKGKQWLALEKDIMEKSATQLCELVMVDWSRLSRDGYETQRVVSQFTKQGNIAFTIIDAPQYQQYVPKDAMDGMALAFEAFGAQMYRERVSKATKAKLDYLKNVKGVKLGPPEKLKIEDKEFIEEQYHKGVSSGKIATALTTRRFMALTPTEKKSDKAVKHAQVSPSLIKKYIKELNTPTKEDEK